MIKVQSQLRKYEKQKLTSLFIKQ